MQDDQVSFPDKVTEQQNQLLETVKRLESELATVKADRDAMKLELVALIERINELKQNP